MIAQPDPDLLKIITLAGFNYADLSTEELAMADRMFQLYSPLSGVTNHHAAAKALERLIHGRRQ